MSPSPWRTGRRAKLVATVPHGVGRHAGDHYWDRLGSCGGGERSSRSDEYYVYAPRDQRPGDIWKVIRLVGRMPDFEDVMPALDVSNLSHPFPESLHQLRERRGRSK